MEAAFLRDIGEAPPPPATASAAAAAAAAGGAFDLDGSDSESRGGDVGEADDSSL